MKQTLQDPRIHLFSSGLVSDISIRTAKQLCSYRKENALFEAIEHSDPNLKIMLGSAFDSTWEFVHEALRKDYLKALLWLCEHHAPLNILKSAKNFLTHTAAPKVILDAWKENPYLLCSLPGIGFSSADKIALASGIDPEANVRLLAMCKEALRQSCDMSGGGAKESLFLSTLDRISQINPSLLNFEQRKSRVDTILKIANDAKIIKKTPDEHGNFLYFSSELYLAEESCANALLLRSTQPTQLSLPDDTQIEIYEKKLGLKLNEDQKKALLTVFDKRISLITGKPGAGKTTLLKVLSPLLNPSKNKILFLAPTGKAAKRMSQSIGLPTQTLHRALSIHPSDSKNKQIRGKIDADVVVVDESSMMDCFLFDSLLSSLPETATLILLGDPEQLPSVGPGRALYDLIQSNTIPMFHLTKVMRQSEQSHILTTAQHISEGLLPDLTDRHLDCLFLPEPDSSKIAPRIAKILLDQVAQKYHILNEVQILCASKKGPSGSVSLNTQLQHLLNPPSASKAQIILTKTESDQLLLREGDKVMHLTNDIDKVLHPIGNTKTGLGLFNGDQGIVSSIDPIRGVVKVNFETGCAHYQLKEAQRSLELSYCTTVHKFQGSEAPVVFFVAHKSTPSILRSRNLIYTGVTRAKNKCLLMGDYHFFNSSLSIQATQQRFTRLSGLLNGTIEPSLLVETQQRSIFEQRALRKALKQPVVELKEHNHNGMPADESIKELQPNASKKRKRL